jgi:hypothetical protein
MYIICTCEVREGKIVVEDCCCVLAVRFVFNLVNLCLRRGWELPVMETANFTTLKIG